MTDDRNNMKFNDQLIRLNQECKKNNPLYRYSNRNVFKCFVREIMQECKCNDDCVFEIFKNTLLSNLCKRWDIEYMYSDFRYLGCYVPVYKNTLTYNQNNYEGFKYDMPSALYDIKQIKRKFYETVEIFNRHSKNKDHDKTRDAFDAMKCAVLDVREFCEGKVECERQLLDYGSFDDYNISEEYLNLIEYDRVDTISHFKVWKFNKDIENIYTIENDVSSSNDVKILENQTPKTTQPNYNVSNATEENNEYSTKPTIIIKKSKFNGFNEILPRYHNTENLKPSISTGNDIESRYYYFDSSVVTLLIFGLILNAIICNLTWKSKSLIILIIFALTLWTVLMIIGIIKYL